MQPLRSSVQPEYDEPISGTVSASAKAKNMTAAKKPMQGRQQPKQLGKAAHSSVDCSTKEADAADPGIEHVASLKLSVHSEDAVNMAPPGESDQTHGRYASNKRNSS